MLFSALSFIDLARRFEPSTPRTWNRVGLTSFFVILGPGMPDWYGWLIPFAPLGEWDNPSLSSIMMTSVLVTTSALLHTTLEAAPGSKAFYWLLAPSRHQALSHSLSLSVYSLCFRCIPCIDPLRHAVGTPSFDVWGHLEE